MLQVAIPLGVLFPKNKSTPKDEAGFKAEVERWKKQGGAKIIEELSKEYAKAQAK